LNLSLSNFTTWLNIHITISIATLVILLLKLALHWRWLARTARNIWPKPLVTPAQNTAAAPALVSLGRMGRREFLQVMGVVGAASFVAMVSASKSLVQTVISTEGTTAENEVTRTASNAVTTSSQPTTSSSSSCVVYCRKGCSSPGHCNRYVDSNNNNLCDLGECA